METVLATARRGSGALFAAKQACAAGFGVELDGIAGLERLDSPAGQVIVLARRSILEVAFGE